MAKSLKKFLLQRQRLHMDTLSVLNQRWEMRLQKHQELTFSDSCVVNSFNFFWLIYFNLILFHNLQYIANVTSKTFKCFAATDTQ